MLRQRQQTLRAELQAIADQASDRAAFLRLAETLTAFLTRLCGAAESLSVMDRQKIVRLLVKEILVGEDTITIHHCIPIPSAPPQNGGSQALNGQNYLLCKGRDRRPLRRAPTFIPIARTSTLVSTLVRFFDRSFQPHLDQMEHGSVGDPASYRLEKTGMRKSIEGTYDTLLIISTSPRRSLLSAFAIPSKADRSTFSGQCIGKVVSFSS